MLSQHLQNGSLDMLLLFLNIPWCYLESLAVNLALKELKLQIFNGIFMAGGCN